MEYRAIFVLVALQLVISACSVQFPVDGKWKLVQINCAGQESAAMTVQAIANSTETAFVEIRGTSAMRTWEFPGFDGTNVTSNKCITKTPMNNIRYTPGHMLIDEPPVETSGDCSGYGFENVPANPNLDYAYTVVGTRLTVTMPEPVRQNATALCGGTNDSIDLIFEEQ